MSGYVQLNPPQLTNGKKLIVASVIVIVIIISIFGKKIFDPIMIILSDYGKYLQTIGFNAIFFLVPPLIITSFPLFFGYGILLPFCGYVMGFPLGFIPAFIGALSGAICCFLCVRHFGQEFVEKRYGKHPLMKGLKKAIEKQPFKFVFLIRLAPWPYGISNALFAVTSVKFPSYVMGTACGLVKILYHVYLGAALDDFVHRSSSLDWKTVAYIVCLLMIIVTTTSILYRWINKELANQQLEIEEEEEAFQMDEFGLNKIV